MSHHSGDEVPRGFLISVGPVHVPSRVRLDRLVLPNHVSDWVLAHDHRDDPPRSPEAFPREVSGLLEDMIHFRT